MSTVDENANVPLEKKPGKGKPNVSAVKSANAAAIENKKKGAQSPNRQQAAYEEFVYRNQNKKAKKKKKNKNKKKNGAVNGTVNGANETKSLISNDDKEVDVKDGCNNDVNEKGPKNEEKVKESKSL